jgi:hypothetical protein
MFGSRKERLVVAALAAGVLGAGELGADGPAWRRFRRLRSGTRIRKIAQFNLNAQQEDLWKKVAAQREAFRTMRAKGEENRAKLRVEIDKPGVDLKKFAQLRDQLRTQMQAQIEAARKQVRAAWFAVYDALDAKQKEQVRVAIRDGMDRSGRGHRGDHRGGPRAESRLEHGTS